MAEVVNLRTVRKRTARQKEAARAAENRIAHGVSKRKRVQAQADREQSLQRLDQHRIEMGDRR